MKMPGTGTCVIQKNHRYLGYAVVLLLLLALSVSTAFAEVQTTPSCNILDESGNPICPGPQSAGQAGGTGQGVNVDLARYFAGIAGPFGQFKGNAEELLEISTSGITGSINQTRHAGVTAETTDSEPGTGTENITPGEEEDSGIKGRMLELAEIAVIGLKGSINQTLHQDDYTSLTDMGPDTLQDAVSEEDDEEAPPNILRVTYANIIRSVLQFIEITPRAIKGSLRNYSTENKSIWTNRSADDLIGSPLYGPVPEERFLPKLDIPVTRVAKNVTQNLTPLLATNITPVQEIPVQPTPTPVPVPVFNLSVDSYPNGALIVLNGNRTGTTPFVMTGLEQKTYTLNLTRAGYLAYGEIVTLDSDKTLDIPLTPTMDTLFVTPGKSTAQNRYGGLYVSSYPDQLDLSIDGVAVKGGTPFLWYGFPEGLHTVQVTRTDKSSGTATYTRSVWVYHDALTTFNIDTEMVLMTKRVSINAGPYSGDEFTINGRFPEGRLPATITAGCPGSFIGIRKGDTYTSFLIPCTNQDTVTMNLADTKEPHPPLLVSSAPDGAEIFIDGFRTGYTTPHTFNEVSGGLHRIMVSKPGLYPKDELITVQIRDGNTTPQKVFFPMENYGEGTIVVDSLPGGASIFLNDWTPGETTPHTFDHMKIGFYEVTVDMGLKPWVEQFELTPSKVSKVVANFNV
jgi:hypothetical protein